MTIDDLDILEAAIKLAMKYQLEELVLADGTKIVKKVHLGKVQPKKKDPINPVSTYNPNETLFLSTPAPEMTIGMFNRYGTNVKGS